MAIVMIAFSGGAGTGKTTITNRVADVLRSEGYSVEVYGEVFREACRQYGITNLDELRKLPRVYTEVEDYAMRLQVVNEKYARNSDADVAIFDRMLLDYLVYSVWYLPIDKWAWLVQEWQYEVLKSLERFDAIFMPDVIVSVECARLWDMFDDGFRVWEDVRVAKEHNAITKRWLGERFGGKLYELRGSLDERVSLAVNVIRRLYNVKSERRVSLK